MEVDGPSAASPGPAPEQCPSSQLSEEEGGKALPVIVWEALFVAASSASAMPLSQFAQSILVLKTAGSLYDSLSFSEGAMSFARGDRWTGAIFCETNRDRKRCRDWSSVPWPGERREDLEKDKGSKATPPHPPASQPPMATTMVLHLAGGAEARVAGVPAAGRYTLHERTRYVGARWPAS